MSQTTPQRGDLVLVTEFGKGYAGLVVKSRILDHHLGSSDEPLLSVIVVKPPVIDECIHCHFAERYHGKPYPPEAPHQPCNDFEGRPAPEPADLLAFAHPIADVPHESHEFTEAQLQSLQNSGVSIGIAYPGNRIPGARWREPGSEELKSLLSDAVIREAAKAKKAEEAKQAEEQKKAEVARAAEEAEKNKPAPIDDITREALVRNKQEELKAAAKPAEAPKAAEETKADPPAGEGGGTGSIN